MPFKSRQTEFYNLNRCKIETQSIMLAALEEYVLCGKWSWSKTSESLKNIDLVEAIKCVNVFQKHRLMGLKDDKALNRLGLLRKYIENCIRVKNNLHNTFCSCLILISSTLLTYNVSRIVSHSNTFPSLNGSIGEIQKEPTSLSKAHIELSNRLKDRQFKFIKVKLSYDKNHDDLDVEIIFDLLNMEKAHTEFDEFMAVCREVFKSISTRNYNLREIKTQTGILFYIESKPSKDFILPQEFDGDSARIRVS